ncbi:MAG: VCBS repeat-containing protein, partial [Bacteroidetes bacterium]|nr:VCBS repeat-containing protein [Bacteroidota bacterium]
MNQFLHYFLCTLLFIPSLIFAQEEDRIFYEYIRLDQEDDPLKDILTKGGQFGQGVAAIGDLDGDLVTELAVGAPDDTAGAVWILFMEKEGKIKSAQKINMTQGGFSGELTPGGGFGSRIEALGDWDGDGNPDLLVGEPKSKTGVLAYGAVWMLLLNADGTVKNHHFFSGRTPGLFKYLPKDQRFGADIAALEDLDGDGLKEIA